MRNTITKLIRELKNSPHTNFSSKGEYLRLEKTWHELIDCFWRLGYEETKELSEDANFPWTQVRPRTSKAHLLLAASVHDINTSLLYYLYYPNPETGEIEPSFDFQVFWDKTLLPALGIIENYLSGHDSDNPEIFRFLRWKREGLTEDTTEIYQPSGSPWWRLAHYITTEEEKKKRLEWAGRQVDKIRAEIEGYQGNLDKNHYYYRYLKEYMNEVDILEGKITNDESGYLVVDIKKDEV